MRPDHVEAHPHDYDLAARLPELAPLAKGEGWAIYAGPGEGAWWIVRDEGSMADLLDEEDAALAEQLVRLERYDDRDRWRAAVDRIGRGDLI